MTQNINKQKIPQTNEDNNLSSSYAFPTTFVSDFIKLSLTEPQQKALRHNSMRYIH